MEERNGREGGDTRRGGGGERKGRMKVKEMGREEGRERKFLP